MPTDATPADTSLASVRAGGAEQKKPFVRSVVETLIALTISFTMAFVFRGFVIEGFQIPTGSMAPTLLGQHGKARIPSTGRDFVFNPGQYSGPLPLSVQGANSGPGTAPYAVEDIVSGEPYTVEGQPLSAGERVFVLKYLDGLYEPRRWDIAVFKAPTENANYIKRMVGVPGEQLALADGDVFARPLPDGEVASGSTPSTWDEPGWSIQRKPERVQRAVWQVVSDAAFTPDSPEFRPRWTADERGRWDGLDSSVFVHEGEGEGTIRFSRVPITDYLPYNQAFQGNPQRLGPSLADSTPNVFPVSDVAVAFAMEPLGDTAADGDGIRERAVRVELRARGRVFRCSLRRTPGGSLDAALELRLDEDGAAWETLASATGLAGERSTRVEFWHVDQALWLFIDGELAAGGRPQDSENAAAYDLTPAQRIEAATGRSFALLAGADRFDEIGPIGPDSARENPLGVRGLYREPELSLTAAGGIMLKGVRVLRDLHYQPYAPRRTVLAADPAFTANLDGDHYFFAGDNSANSTDSRLMPNQEPPVFPWIAERYGSPPGLIHEDLITGRAFVVYLPAPFNGRIPMFDFGKMRWIW